MARAWILLFFVTALALAAHAGALDADGDGVCDRDEDRDGDGDLDDHDTDGDGIPNYRDSDDDGDGIATLEEDFDGDGDPSNDDIDANGVADYLDAAVPLDIDRDGYVSEDWGGDDCNDRDRLTYPGAEEFYYDGQDQDCMGGDDFDADLDGFASAIELAQGTDCDDQDPTVYPGAPEDASDVDRDCDGFGDPTLGLVVRGGWACDVGPRPHAFAWGGALALLFCMRSRAAARA